MNASHYNIKSRALLMHHCKSSGALDVTVHNVTSASDDRQVIGEGRVVGAEEKAELVNILNEDAAESFTLQSDRVLAKTPYALAWWVPKGEKEIQFRTYNDGEACVVSHRVHFPSMIGIYMRGSLRFAVTKGGKNVRPSHDTPLYHIPLPNLFRSGAFCRGNVNLPAAARESHIPTWNAFVFDTANTHFGGFVPMTGITVGPREASKMSAKQRGEIEWQRMLDAYNEAERKGRFPVGRLIPMDLTLGEWMEKLDKGDA